ncbi:MAG: hypothetical protein KBF57_10910 [Saprospiraceae bacterium]|nr:hypothetical protein [Saprospiraceae bacterium]MBP9195186.1 hypothetical protein [Saprospiraceae bacterium]
MNNQIEISTDRVNVYATIDVKVSVMGTRVLFVFILFALVFFGFLLTHIKADEVVSMIIPVLLILVFMIGMPSKYLLWNLYGQEFLIVNTTSVSWSYNYGIIRTNVNTEIYNRLGIGYEKVITIDNIEMGRLIFYNYRQEDNLPEIIHQTTALLSSSDIKKLSDSIQDIFISEFNLENNFIPFSQN